MLVLLQLNSEYKLSAELEVFVLIDEEEKITTSFGSWADSGTAAH